MSFMANTWLVASIILVIFYLQPILAAQEAPCYISFGDFLVDNGNNNNLNAMSKANWFPYGIDNMNEVEIQEGSLKANLSIYTYTSHYTYVCMSIVID